MNRLLCSFACFCITPGLFSQQSRIDSLRREANLSQNDTVKMVVLRNIARVFSEINFDSAYHYAEETLQLARRLHFKLDEGGALREMGYGLLNKGNFPRSLQISLSSLAILENPNSEKRVLVGKFQGDDELIYRTAEPRKQRLSEIGFTQQILGVLYANLHNYEKALIHHRLAKQYAEESGNTPLQSIINMTMGRVYLNLKKPDSALISERHAYNLVIQNGYRKYLGSIMLNTGRIYLAMGKNDSAIHYFRQALDASTEYYYFRGVAASNRELGEIKKQMGQYDSCLFYLRNAQIAAHNLDAPEVFLSSYKALADYFKTVGNNDSAVKYQSLIIKISDSLFNSKRIQEFQNIDFDEQQRQAQIEAAETAYRQKMGTYALLAGLALFLLIAFILWRSSRQRQLANIQLSRQKRDLESTLETLKTTQNQLIQSEKMASLGELTAGIAHEIQNPLNFVNNFAEVNQELLEELRNEKAKPDRNEQLENELLNSIGQNLEKINHHGKRADAIVKGMLQHSRTSSPQKEPIDINALVDEYLRLAYHGLRAKDKSFNTKFETDFDPSLKKITAVPQEIGRVVLNLINNAFYAVSEKSKMQRETTFPQGQTRPDDPVGRGYDPKIFVSTKKLNGTAEIKVRDNGLGIPHEIADKIFQPFFTTKPAGQGTGLGLSLAYDIITKGHGGELKVDTKEGEGTEFVIQLPIMPEQ